MADVALILPQLEEYNRRGFVVLPGLFSADEVSTYVDECSRLEHSGIVHPDNLRTHVLNSERPPDRLDPVIDLSPTLHNLASSPRLTGPAAQLLGDEPSLFKDKVIFKPPGMQGYKTHQDYAYWQWLPARPENLVTVLVALDAATVENGAVEFFPGKHDCLLTSPGAPADVDESALDVPGEVVETSPGDVVMFHSLTPHRSGDNSSSAMRRQLYLSYNGASHGDLYKTYYDHLHEWVLSEMGEPNRKRAYFR
ncbi:MAG TPA: phytanoyl-CoA dioxygenase family protein [Acidimicrobiales bacterium]|nr:phytanoyl-CoA dioxygenase family protein [Acidimicrobiales bacterium]